MAVSMYVTLILLSHMYYLNLVRLLTCLQQWLQLLVFFQTFTKQVHFQKHAYHAQFEVLFFGSKNTTKVFVLMR